VPIGRKAFELEVNTEEWMKGIHDFLIEHKEEAFTYGELKKEFGVPEPDLFGYSKSLAGQNAEQEIENTFDKALSALVERGAVEKKRIKIKYLNTYQDYYSYGPNPLTV